MSEIRGITFDFYLTLVRHGTGRGRGPDGEVDGTYREPGTAVAAVHDGERVWQVRVLFSRERPVGGPSLGSYRLEVATDPQIP